MSGVHFSRTEYDEPHEGSQIQKRSKIGTIEDRQEPR